MYIDLASINVDGVGTTESFETGTGRWELRSLYNDQNTLSPDLSATNEPPPNIDYGWFGNFGPYDVPSRCQRL